MSFVKLTDHDGNTVYVNLTNVTTIFKDIKMGGSSITFCLLGDDVYSVWLRVRESPQEILGLTNE